MNFGEKHKIAYRMTSIASTSMDFVNDYLLKNPKTDSAYLRSLYILLSYSFELILKSRITMLYGPNCKECLSHKLKNLSHDFKKISKDLGSKELHNIGINKIESKTASCNNPIKPKEKYKIYRIITTDNNEIIIEDFIDIRYGCMDGGVRKVDNTEHKKIMGYITNMEKINQKVKSQNAL